MELLNSAAEMFLTSGETRYADRAERIAMNALPGAFMNGSMWSLNCAPRQCSPRDGCHSTCRCSARLRRALLSTGTAAVVIPPPPSVLGAADTRPLSSLS